MPAGMWTMLSVCQGKGEIPFGLVEQTTRMLERGMGLPHLLMQRMASLARHGTVPQASLQLLGLEHARSRGFSPAESQDWVHLHVIRLR